MVRRVLSLATVVVVLAAPGFAQRTTDAQDVRQQVEAFTVKWVETYNGGDAKALLAMSAPDAFSIDPSGMLSGAQEIEGRIENNVQVGIKITGMKADDDRQGGQDRAGAGGPYTGTFTANPARAQLQ